MPNRRNFRAGVLEKKASISAGPFACGKRQSNVSRGRRPWFVNDWELKFHDTTLRCRMVSRSKYWIISSGVPPSKDRNCSLSEESCFRCFVVTSSVRKHRVRLSLDSFGNSVIDLNRPFVIPVSVNQSSSMLGMCIRASVYIAINSACVQSSSLTGSQWKNSHFVTY